MNKLLLFGVAAALYTIFSFTLKETPFSQAENVPDSPCEIVNATELREIVGVDGSYEITMEAKDYTYPACSFRWEDGKVVKTMEIAGTVREFPSPSEVMIVLAKETTEANYNTSIKVYKDGETVEGVGDRATWGTKMSQLTFQKGELLFHVNVKVNNDVAVNKEKALEIASLILTKV